MAVRFFVVCLALAFIVVSGAWAQSSTAPETDEPLDDSLRVEIVDEAFTGLSILQGGGELLSNTSVVKLDDLYWLWLIQHEFNIDEEYILPVSGRIDLPEGQYITDSYTGSLQIDAISQNCDRRNLTTYDEFVLFCDGWFDWTIENSRTSFQILGLRQKNPVSNQDVLISENVYSIELNAGKAFEISPGMLLEDDSWLVLALPKLCADHLNNLRCLGARFYLAEGDYRFTTSAFSIDELLDFINGEFYEVSQGCDRPNITLDSEIVVFCDSWVDLELTTYGNIIIIVRVDKISSASPKEN